MHVVQELCVCIMHMSVQRALLKMLNRIEERMKYKEIHGINDSYENVAE